MGENFFQFVPKPWPARGVPLSLHFSTLVFITHTRISLSRNKKKQIRISQKTYLWLCSICVFAMIHAYRNQSDSLIFSMERTISKIDQRPFSTIRTCLEWCYILFIRYLIVNSNQRKSWPVCPLWMISEILKTKYNMLYIVSIFMHL